MEMIIESWSSFWTSILSSERNKEMSSRVLSYIRHIAEKMYKLDANSIEEWLYIWPELSILEVFTLLGTQL